MKININNKTEVPIKIISEIIDRIIEDERQITIYDGMIEYELFDYKKVKYKMKLEYKITCIKICVEELGIEAKKVSMKGVKMPKLPKKKEVK